MTKTPTLPCGAIPAPTAGIGDDRPPSLWEPPSGTMKGDWSRTLSPMPQDWHSHCCYAEISSVKERAMTRDELTRKILSIKRAKGLTWKAIGGGSAVYLTAALMGQ